MLRQSVASMAYGACCKTSRPRGAAERATNSRDATGSPPRRFRSVRSRGGRQELDSPFTEPTAGRCPAIPLILLPPQRHSLSQETKREASDPSGHPAMRDMGDGMGPMTMAPPRADHTPTRTAAAAPHKMAMVHMTFFWGDRAVVLFPGWPGDRSAGMYLLCLLFVLALAALTEALAVLLRRLARRGGGSPAPASSAALLTAVHAARMGMAYLVMMAVMSFNVGVLLAAVAGHALGFLLARSRVHPTAARDGGAPRELGGLPPSDGSKA